MEGGAHWIGIEDATTNQNIEEEEDLQNGGVGAERDGRAAGVATLRRCGRPTDDGERHSGGGRIVVKWRH
jgi:hypothetical protein